MRKLFAGLLITVSVLGTTLLSGCEQQTQIGGQPRPKTFTSIVSLSPSTTEILLSSGVTIKGRTSACNFPEFSVGAVKIVGGVKPDYEALATVKPDLIVYESNIYNEQDKAKIKGLGAEIFELRSETVADFEIELAKLGGVTGSESTSAEYADKVHRAVGKAKSDAPNPKPKVAVILAGANGSHFILGTKGFIADCYKVAGSNLIGPNTDKFEPLKPEFLIAENPDIIFVPGKAEVFLKDTRMSGLKAVKSGKVYGINADASLRRGSRVPQLIENIDKALEL